MKKIGFIGSIVSILLGAVTLIATTIINEVMPKVGYLAFQKLLSGTYSPSDYVMNFSYTNTVAIILIVVGLGFGSHCFISEKSSK